MKIKYYTGSQVLLHWLSAGVILWTLMSGFYVSLTDVSPLLKEWVARFNVSLTMLFIPLFIIRVCLALMQSKVSRVNTDRQGFDLAVLGHRAIYWMTALVLITGVLMMDRPIGIFGLVSFTQPLSDPASLMLFFKVHVASCLALSALVAGHVAAVGMHRWRGKCVLGRMSLRKADRQAS